MIHSNGPSVTRMRPWLARLYARFTRMANRISRVFCLRQVLIAQFRILPSSDHVIISSSSIPARSHTFMEIDHEIISTVILLPSAESFKKGCCQLQAKVCARSTG